MYTRYFLVDKVKYKIVRKSRKSLKKTNKVQNIGETRKMKIYFQKKDQQI